MVSAFFCWSISLSMQLVWSGQIRIFHKTTHPSSGYDTLHMINLTRLPPNLFTTCEKMPGMETGMSLIRNYTFNSGQTLIVQACITGFKSHEFSLSNILYWYHSHSHIHTLIHVHTLTHTHNLFSFFYSCCSTPLPFCS